MGDQVRVGVIGTSWWADMLLLPPLQSHQAAQSTAICGRNRTRAEEMASKYAVQQVFTDYRQMIDQGNLDAVVVAAPDDLHYEMVMYALDAGLHVLCEKPVANNAEQALAMYERAEAAGVKHLVMYTWDWLPHHRYLKQLIDEGFIGRPYHACFTLQGGNGRSSAYAWRFDGQRANGVFGDQGSHLVRLARSFMGDIANVSANLATHVQHVHDDGQSVKPVNDSALVTVEFASGAQATLQASAVAHLGSHIIEFSVVLYGEGGTLESSFNFAQPDQPIQALRAGEDQFVDLTIPDAFWKGGSRGEIGAIFAEQSIGPRLFIDSILDDRPLEPGLYEGYKVQQVIDAALKSHETGQRITIQ